MRFEFSLGEPIAGRTAVLVGTGAMRACNCYTKPWPFLWVRQKGLRYVYVPPFGPIYRDPLMIRTAQLFYKELAAEFKLV